MWFERSALAGLGWLLGIVSAVLLLLAVSTAALAYLKAGPNVMPGVHGVLQDATLPLDGAGSFAAPSAAYSFRKLRSAYSGPAIRIRRASDNLETDINFLGFVPGLGAPLDYVAANTHCAATTCFGKTWYDQSGNARDVTNATAGTQPQLFFNCQNGLPCLGGIAGSLLVSGVSTSFTTGVISYSGVFFNPPVDCNGSMAITGPSKIGATTNGYYIFNGSVSITGTAAQNAFHAVAGIINGASSVVVVDGTTTSGTVAAVGGSGAITLGFATCRMTENVVWADYALTPAALQANQKSFWGTP